MDRTQTANSVILVSFIVFSLLLIAIFSVLGFMPRPTKTPQIPQTVSVVVGDAVENESSGLETAPPLGQNVLSEADFMSLLPAEYSQYDWSTDIIDKLMLEGTPREMSINTMSVALDNSEDDPFYINLEGKIYTTTIISEEPLDVNSENDLFTHITSKLQSMGYTHSVNHGGYYWQSIAADGVQGSQRGLLKLTDAGVQLVSYSYHLKDTWVFDEVAVPQLQCPCTTEVSVFVSNVIGGDVSNLNFYVL